MSRIAKLDVAQWDAELRRMTAADQATPLEQGAMRMFAHRPAIAKGIVALGAGLKTDRALSERLMELIRLRIAFPFQVNIQTPGATAVSGDSAAGHAYTSELVTDTEGKRARWTGLYTDRYVRRDGRWLFQERSFRILSPARRSDVGGASGRGSAMAGGRSTRFIDG
jgi:hypothetical protein